MLNIGLVLVAIAAVVVGAVAVIGWVLQITTTFQGFILRRVGRHRPEAEVLTIPKWLEPSESWTQRLDDVSQTLREYEPRRPRFPPLSEPQVPTLEPPAQVAENVIDVAGESVLEIEAARSILRRSCGCRVRLEDLSAKFSYPSQPDVPLTIEPPPAPISIETPTSTPVLRLPYYGRATTNDGQPQKEPLSILRPLNALVDAANSKARRAYESSLLRMERERQTRLSINSTRARLYEEAMTRWRDAETKLKVLVAARSALIASKRKEFESAAATYLQELRALNDGLTMRDPNCVERYFRLMLLDLDLPPPLPRDFHVSYDRESRILVLEHQAPDVQRITFLKPERTASGQTSRRITMQDILRARPRGRPVSIRERKQISQQVVQGLAIRLAVECAHLDKWELVAGYAVNLWVHNLDGRTGKPRDVFIAALFATGEALREIQIESVDPVACFASLKGRHGEVTNDYEPVEPIVRLNRNDDRFVVGRAVLDKISDETNLAALDWEEFEHLIRELFERAFSQNGGAVEITRASRDRGVDAVVFDPDPIRGGKIVVQAKRYVNAVDVAAVRDLYGTVVNEGAMKGILVTTSHFGPDAYAFARDKPLALLSGNELLWLLERHGYKFRIDLEEARAQLGLK